MKVEPLLYGERKVYTVAGFNRGVADWLARLPTLWIEGEVTELRRHDRWASVFFTLKDPAEGDCVPGVAAAAHLRRAEARPERRRARPRLRPAGALRREGGVPTSRPLDRAVRARRPPRRARAAEARARRRRSLRQRSEASASPLSPPDRARHRQRRRGEARRAVDDHGPLPGRPDPRLRDPRPGAARRHGDRRGADGGRGGGGHRRDRARARRRQLRRPAPVQRRAGRPRGRRVPRAGRLRGRARAGHPALRSRRRRSRLDAHRGGKARRARSRRAVAATSAARVDRSSAAFAGRSNAIARCFGAPTAAWSEAPGGRSTATRAGSRSCAIGSVASRRCSSSAGGSASSGRARGSRRSRRARRSSAGTRSSATDAGIVRSAGTLAAGERVEVELAAGGFGAVVEECARMTELELRGGATRARGDRRAARAGAAEPRRGDRALGTRRGAAPALPRPARCGPREDRGARRDGPRRRLPSPNPAQERRIAPMARPSADMLATIPLFSDLEPRELAGSRSPSRSASSRPARRSRPKASPAPASS